MENGGAWVCKPMPSDAVFLNNRYRLPNTAHFQTDGTFGVNNAFTSKAALAQTQVSGDAVTVAA
jgi:hypothetical protein